MSYVYILYQYQEHGAEEVHATTDRRDLPVMLERMPDASPEELKTLTALLRRPEQELAQGWMEHPSPNEPLEP